MSPTKETLATDGITTKQGNWSRYNAIIISIALFLVFDLSVLVLNFYIADEIKDDAVAVNLAGRQRMLSQRTVKSLLQYQTERLAGNDSGAERARRELLSTVSLFDDTFTAFKQGGQVSGADGQPVLITAVTTDHGLQVLAEAEKIWTPYLERLAPIREHETVTQSEMTRLTRYAAANNLALLKLMNDLTNDLEGVAAAKAVRLRIIQSIGIGLALINFGIILFHFLRKLRETDRQSSAYARRLKETNDSLELTTSALKDAQKQTDEILDTVSEGLFLINPEGRIADQHSRALSRIIPGRPAAGQNLAEMLRPMVTEKIYGMTQDYLTLLFRASVKERMLLNVNPLDDVEVKVDAGDGRLHRRHLSFTFNRVLHDGEIRDALVTVRDITQQVLLAQELEASETRANAQMEMLLNMIQLPPGELQTFLNSTERRLNGINNKLRNIDAQHDLKQLSNNIFRDIHSIKGDAAAIGFELFSQASHDMEDRLSEIRDKTHLSGEDFVSSTLGLDTLFNHLANTRELIKRFSSLSQTSANASPTVDKEPTESLIDSLQRLTQRLAKDLDKSLVLDTRNFQPVIPADTNKAEDFKDALIQMVRNSAVHGIERADARAQKGKPTTGTITLRSTRDEHGITVSVSDDGRGLDLEAIKRRAIKRGLLPLEESEDSTSQSIAALIFNPGFSTQDTASAHAGRGVGMDIIRSFIAKTGGRIRMSFARDKYFELALVLPEAA